LSNDPVAADAKAAVLFGYQPEEIGFILLGNKRGLGTFNFNVLTEKKVVI